MEEYYIGAYWLSRRETVEVCARRAMTFFRLLASCDPLLSRWYRKGRTLEDALEHPFELDATNLANVFGMQEQQEGRFCGEGFSLGLWNGEDNEAASDVSIHCGDASLRVPNRCVISPPEGGAPAERLLQAPVLVQVLRAMIVAWEPEWGVVTSHEHRRKVSNSAEVGTFIGWVTYFSHRRGALPSLPPAAHVEPVEDLGSLVLLTPERLSASNLTHVELARDMAGRLAHTGMLSPLRPWSA